MKKFAFFITILLCFTMACSNDPCGETKTEFLAEFDEYFSQLPIESKHYTDADWEEHDAKFRKFVEECYEIHEPKLTTGEKKTFWVKTMNYYYKRYGAGIANELMDKGHPAYNSLKKYLSELENNPNEALRDIINQAGGEEMKALMNEISGDVEKWGKKLEQIFSND